MNAFYDAKRGRCHFGGVCRVSVHGWPKMCQVCCCILLLEKGKLIMDKPHVLGGMDSEQDAYFLEECVK